MEITKEIQDLISKQLPGMHAEALKEFIQQSQKESKELEKIKSQLESKLEEISKLNGEVERLTQLNIDDKKLKADQIELQNKVTSLELEKLKFDVNAKMFELRATEAEKRSLDIYTLTNILFQNERIVSRIMESKNKYNPGYSSGAGYVSPHTEIENYNYSKEELKYKEETPKK